MNHVSGDAKNARVTGTTRIKVVLVDRTNHTIKNSLGIHETAALHLDVFAEGVELRSCSYNRAIRMALIPNPMLAARVAFQPAKDDFFVFAIPTKRLVVIRIAVLAARERL